MRRRYRSIQQKIFLLILPICLVPALVFLLLTGLGSRLTFEETMATELNRRAASFSERFDLFLANRIDRLLKLVQENQEGLIDYSVDNTDEVITDAIIYLGSNDYTAVQSTTVTANIFFRQYLQLESFLAQWWAKRDSLNPRGEIDELRLSVPGRLKPIHLVVLIVPDGRQGEVLFIMDIDRLVRQFTQNLTQMPEQFIIFSSHGWEVFANRPLDDSITHSLRTVMAGQKTLPEHFTIRTPYISLIMAPARSQFFTSLHLSGRSESTWTIILPYDMAAYLGPHDTLIWLSVLITLVLVLGILGLAALAARRMIEPLKSLRRQAEAVAHGDLNVRVSVPFGDEIGDLAEAFNTMSGRLQATYHTLEERIEENRLRAEHINVINEMTNAIIRTLNLDGLFDILKSEVCKVTPYDAMWIALVEGAPPELRLKHITPQEMTPVIETEQGSNHWALHRRVIETGETAHLELGAIEQSASFEARLARLEGLQSFMIAPLPSRKGIIGTLTVASRSPNAYNMQLADVLTSLASTVAISIEQSEMFSRISRFANELEQKVAERSKDLQVATEKLMQTERYFAMGRMAGNLAHEINNPLGIIKNYIALVRNSLHAATGGRRKSDPQLANIDIINEEVNRIARLVRQMLDLHRPVEHEVMPVDMSEMASKLLSIMTADLEKHHITLEMDLARDLPKPNVSPDLIRQVILNLVNNAVDAMGETGGTLSVRTTAISEWSDGREQTTVSLRVSDTGPGIPAELLPQIFDPFFTTKSPDKGTGLGLYVSYSIAQVYQGSLEGRNRPDGGAVFTLTLPVADSSPDQAER